MAAAGNAEAAAHAHSRVSARPAPHWQLNLLGSWSLRRNGVSIPLRSREQRVIALLGLHGERPRQYIAGLLWPESTESRAAGSLRAAVWKIDQAAPGLVARSGTQIGLASGVRTDIRSLIDTASDLLDPLSGSTDQLGLVRALRVLLVGELLPGWYDDWVLLERGRVQDLRQQALERLAQLLSESGDIAAALRAAQGAVAIEPLRESAHRSLIAVQISAGNHIDALRHYESFRTSIESELGIPPSEQLEVLVRPILTRAPAHR